MASETTFLIFSPGTEGAPSLADDPKIKLLASCIVNQQAAGYKNLIDVRQFSCPECRAPGFNTGWGAVRFTCEAEVVGGEMAEPCKAKAPP